MPKAAGVEILRPENLSRLRGAYRTQQEVADAAEISVDYYRKLESGARKHLGGPASARLAKALGMEPDDFRDAMRKASPAQDRGTGRKKPDVFSERRLPPKEPSGKR